MTRVGLMAAVIIIVVASIFFGFRKAARDHENDDKPKARVTAKGTPLENARSLRQIDPESRKLLVEHIAEARGKRDAVGELPADYVKTQRAALEALVVKCGKQSVTITIAGEPDIGGLVETTDASPCVREVLEAVELVAPPAGGRAELTLSPS